MDEFNCPLGSLCNPTLVYQGCKVRVSGELSVFIPIERRPKAVTLWGRCLVNQSDEHNKYMDLSFLSEEDKESSNKLEVWEISWCCNTVNALRLFFRGLSTLCLKVRGAGMSLTEFLLVAGVCRSFGRVSIQVG